MVKSFLKKIGFALVVIMMANAIVLAQNDPPKDVEEAGFKSRCATADPKCASSPAKCISSGDKNRTPINCIYLQEPIGGKTGYDLFKITESTDPDKGSKYQLWHGEAILKKEIGPVQAILAYEEGKESQGPFVLLYNYLGLVYNFLSGIIIGFVVLVTIVGGIRMSASAGNETTYGEGKNMIIKALVGMVLWFTASVILYTINPTFFTF